MVQLKIVFVLVCAFKAFLSTLVVFLQQLEKSFVRVEQHFVLLDVDTFRGYRMLSKLRSHHDAKTVLAYHIFLKALHAW